MKYSEFKNELGRSICRGCLNKKYNLDLTPEDCGYIMYPMVCTACGKVSHIVADIKFSKRISMRFRKQIRKL